MEADVKTLKDAEIKLSNSLNKNIKKNIPDFDYKKSDQLRDSAQFIPSLLSYFEENIGSNFQQLVHGNNHKQLYEEAINMLFIDRCLYVKDKLRYTIERYELFVYSKETDVDKDEFVLNWLENYKICQSIMNDQVLKSILTDFKKSLK